MLREINRRVNPAFRHDITFESLKSALEEPNANAAARRLGCGRNVVISRLREFGYENWDDFRVACDSNHKVRYVIPVGLDTSVPVYDLEVDEWDNFALSGGVFVHNSKDLADALACAAVNAVVVGGREEGPNARTYFEPATFSVSEKFELPFGVTHGELRRMWQTNTTLPF